MNDVLFPPIPLMGAERVSAKRLMLKGYFFSTTKIIFKKLSHHEKDGKIIF